MDLTEGDWEMLRLWRITRSTGTLPDHGGVLDQAAIMMEALDAMEAMYPALLAEFRRNG